MIDRKLTGETPAIALPTTRRTMVAGTANPIP